MSILDQPTNDVATANANAIRTSGQMIFKQIVASYRQNYSRIWNHPSLSSQQVLGSLGSDAADCLAKGQAMKDFINSIVPNTITTSSPDVVVHEDGTTTVVVG